MTGAVVGASVSTGAAGAGVLAGTVAGLGLGVWQKQEMVLQTLLETYYATKPKVSPGRTFGENSQRASCGRRAFQARLEIVYG